MDPRRATKTGNQQPTIKQTQPPNKSNIPELSTIKPILNNNSNH